MATTRKADVSNSIRQVWGDELFYQAESLTFWGQFEGEAGSSMPIIRKDDLEGKGAGDTLKTDIVLSLTGAGQTGDTTSLEGNEEALKFRQTSITLSQLSHGVRWTELAEALITHDMRVTARNQLAKWLAGKFDDAIWAELTGATVNGITGGTTIPTLSKWAAGSATTRATVADGDATGRLKLADISDIKAYAQTTHKIEPIRMEDGQEYFGLALHPYTNLSLKKDSTYQQAERDAGERGRNNPLFTGASFVWDGVIGYVSDRVPRYTNGSIMVADNVFFGAQSMSRGFGMHPDWREEEFDYGRSAGVAIVTLKGDKLNVFDLTAAGSAAAADLTSIGSMVLYAAAVAPTA